MTKTARHIIITGFMGAGKTTVAAALARRLACPSIDLDRFIMEREGRSARAIIEEDGEESFRETETLALRAALDSVGQHVIALGGGAWTIERNRALIEERCAFTVWLDAPFELCWQRIKRAGDTRPLARDERQARELYRRRRAFYSLAALRVAAHAGRSAQELAAIIAAALRSPNAPTAATGEKNEKVKEE